MATDKFNWKGLFVNNEEGTSNEKVEKDSPKQETASTSFPHSKPISTFPSDIPKGTANSSILSSIVEMYESGFDSLNQPGYDFYEFFKAIKAVNSNDANVYKMALSMAQGVDSKVSKTTLLTQAGFYVTEIDKVHKHYQEKGNAKRNELQQQIKNQKENLSSEISSLEKQILEMQTKASNLKNELQNLDAKLLSDASEIDQKINANDMAKTKILDTIQSVIDGIKNNL